MPQLIVRDIEEKVVRKLKERAGAQGVSMEEAHRAILREALLTPHRPSFKKFLLQIPPGPEFPRLRDMPRDVEL